MEEEADPKLSEGNVAKKAKTYEGLTSQQLIDAYRIMFEMPYPDLLKYPSLAETVERARLTMRRAARAADKSPIAAIRSPRIPTSPRNQGASKYIKQHTNIILGKVFDGFKRYDISKEGMIF